MITDRLPTKWLLWHGAGQAGQSVQGFALGFLFIYYNQVLGLSGTLSGLALAITSVVDAVTDPTVGSWSDGFKSRWGRRHPFLFVSVLPIAVLFVALFAPPPWLSEFQLFLWFTVVYSLMRTALTVYHVPYLALGAEVTQNYVERTRIAAYRGFIGKVASLLVVFAGWRIAFRSTEANPAPQLTAEPYLPFAIASAVVMAVFMAASAWKTMDVIPRLPSMGLAGRRFHFRHVYGDLIEALRGLSFRSLFLGHLICTIYWGTTGTLALHLKTFFWQLDSLAIEWWQYAGILGGMVGIPFTPYFNRLLDKKWSVILGVVVCVLGGTGPVMLALAGLMPTSYFLLVALLVAFAFLSEFAIEPVGVSIASMMGDMSDEHELRTGARQEGVYFAAFSFAGKCSGAIGPLVAGIAVDIVGLNPDSTPGEVPAQVLFDFGLVYAFLAVFVLFAIWVFWPYNLDRKRHEWIIDELRRRRRVEPNPDPAHVPASGDSAASPGDVPGSLRPDSVA